MIFKTKQRIVEDKCLGFEVQFRYWWSPFWCQKGFTNSHRTIEQAREYAKKPKIVEYIK